MPKVRNRRNEEKIRKTADKNTAQNPRAHHENTKGRKHERRGGI
jgi:hypothetical protein